MNSFLNNDAIVSLFKDRVLLAICEACAHALGKDEFLADENLWQYAPDEPTLIAIQYECRMCSLSRVMMRDGMTPRGMTELWSKRPRDAYKEREFYPLSYTQKGIFAECVKHHRSHDFRLRRRIYLSPEVDCLALAQAMEAVLQIHPALATRITVDEEGELYQFLDADFSSAPSSLPLVSDGCHPFDWKNEKLFAWALVQEASGAYLEMEAHSLIMDEAALFILLEDVEHLYHGESIEPESMPCFANALREENLKGQDYFEEARAWYLSRFEGLNVDSLPQANSDAEGETYAQHHRICLDDMPHVESFLQEHGIEASTLFTAAWAYTLARWNNEPEAFFNLVNHGRTLSIAQRLLSHLSNVLPFYLSTAGHEDCTSFLKEVESLIHCSRNYSIYGIAQLSEETSVQSQLIFSYLDERERPKSFCGSAMDGESQQLSYLPSLLSGQVSAQEAGFTLSLSYAEAAYTPELIAQLAESYCEVLAGLMQHESLSQVGLMSDSQRLEVQGFNSSAPPLKSPLNLVQCFAQQVLAQPEHLALVCGEQQYSYAQLDDCSSRLAARLIQEGVQASDVVPILVDRNEWMLIAALAVLKCAAIYQPLDPSYPSERLLFMLQDSGAKRLILDEDLAPLVEGFEGTYLFTHQMSHLPPCAQPLPQAGLDDDFVLLYTSGSTGQAKGCALAQRGLLHFIQWAHGCYEMGPHSKVAAYASFGFDAHMIDFYPTLTAGGTLYIIAGETRHDLIELEAYYKQVGINQCFMTTQLGRQFAQVAQLPELRYLTVGGEALVPLNPPKGFELINLYGPTEGTIAVTYFHYQRMMKRVPIGRPMPSTQVYVLDSAGRLQPPGAVGELLIAGPQVAHGYLHQPELSARAFIPNPFAGDDAGCTNAYRTGDVVRWLPDGQLDFIGRRDAQVKVRGFRIELSEVEAIVRAYPSVKDATVQAFESPMGGKFITAYVVVDDTWDREQFKTFILENKPAYLLPEFIVTLDAIPLTQNHKVNRRALPDPLQSEEAPAADSDTAEIKPNLLELKLIDMVAEILGHRSFGVYTPLAHVGLSSIAAIKLAILIYKRFLLKVDAKNLLRKSCIADLENQILERFLSEDAATDLAQQDASQLLLKQACALSASQLGIYYECLKYPEATIYNLPACLPLPAHLTGAQVEQALADILAAHPNLSLCFENGPQGPSQRQAPHALKLDCSELSEADFGAYRESFIRPFDLAAGPLYRFELVRYGEKLALLADFHHLISDGYSWNLFLDEFCRVLEGAAPEPEHFGLQDTVAEELGQDFSEAEAYYAELLKNFEASTELEADLPTKGEEPGPEAQHVQLLGGAKIDAFCATLHRSPAEFLLSTLTICLSRYVNSKSLYINMISSGRSDPRLAESMGMFVKTIPWALTWADETVGELAERSAQAMAQGLDFEHYPYAKVASQYHYKPSITYAYQVGLLSEHRVGAEVVEAEFLNPADQLAMFKLGVFIEWVEGQYALVLRYDKALYSAELMAHFAESFAAVLEQQLSGAEGLAKHISLITPKREIELQGMRCVAQIEPPIQLLHHGLEKQAREKGEQKALIACDGQFSFDEFNAMANRVAHGLKSRGVCAGMRVALLLPRNSRLMAALYGTLKAGAAYIPCDPDYPADRVAHILEDSEAKFIVTEAAKLADFPDGVALDVEELLLTAEASNPDVAITPEHLAYIIYTSGSTGRPKGVMLRHKGICSYLTAHPANAEMLDIVQNVKALLAVTTISFDVSLLEVVNALFNGVTLVLADDDQTRNPMDLAQLFAETGADCFSATPSRFLQFMELPEFCEALTRCQVLLAGGEIFPQTLLERLQRLTKARLYNVYGPTEATVSCNTSDVTHATRIDVGRPLLNYIEFIVDADGNELPVGLVGELYIGGPGVALGYNKLEELTAKQFISFKGERVYKSGDYARWNPQGAVDVLGRKDNQIKLRGLRIELGEIESCLSNLEGIKRVAVCIRKLQGGSEELCAYYSAEHPMDVEWMREQLSQKLTVYMVPTLWMQLDKLPQTPNGKTDLRALPEPQRQAKSGNYVAPRGEREEFYCQLFAQILGMERVSARDSFFELGGTSLVATRVIVEAGKAGIRLAYGELFSHPSARQLAQLGTSEQVKETTQEDEKLSHYPYEKFDDLFKANNLENFKQGEAQELGSVLLTGATGYLGIHILRQLLEEEDMPIYCLLRDADEKAGCLRLQSLLQYYFDKSYTEAFEQRIIPLMGDLRELSQMAALQGAKIGTLINCAANVKHFSQNQDIADVNLGGVDEVIKFCLSQGTRLVHISTISVSGLSVNHHIDGQRRLLEQELYIGQYLDNQYTSSKFLAERHVLEAIAEQGLQAKIMRVGNLAARNDDGTFQINAESNSAMGQLRAYALTGCCPYAHLEESIEFSPVDETARAILLLAQTTRECCLFHPYNQHQVLLGDVIFVMKGQGIAIDIVEEETYQQALSQAQLDPEKLKYLASIIAYQDMAHGQEFAEIAPDNQYSMQVLYRLGYHWPSTSTDYVSRFINKLMGSGYFTP